jgi:hypothetical protein
MDHERRRAPRYQLIADAEITEVKSKSQVNAKTSDVSIVGCFMNSPTALPMGTKIKVRLTRNQATFTGDAVVARVIPMGMGVNFSAVKPDQMELLRTWLSETSRAA